MKKMKLPFGLLLSTLLLYNCETEYHVNDPGNLVPKTVDQDASLPSITVNGIRLHTEAFGNPNDPLVIVLHAGPGGDYRSLMNCKDLAAQGYRTVFYDQRGTGLSQRVPYSSYTQEEFYDDLREVIVHYRTSPTQKVFLLGHSWGAMLATAYINRYPTAIDGAILAEPGGFKWQDIEEYAKRVNPSNIFGEGLNDAVYIDQFITAEQNDHAILDYKFELWAIAGSEDSSPLGKEGKLPQWRRGAVSYRAYFDLGKKLHPDWTTDLHQYTTPVLFVYSENNKVYGPDYAKEVSSAYPNVQLFETLGAGHDMLSSAKGWSNTFPAIINYLNSLK